MFSNISKRFAILVAILFLSLISDAQTIKPAEKPANEYLEQKGEVYFSFELPEQDVFSKLLNIISVDNIADEIVFAYANSFEFELFLEQDISYSVLIHPGDVDFDLNMMSSDEIKQEYLTETWDFYPTYEAYENLMYQFESDFPELVEVVNIGQTVMGRNLLFAKITSDVEIDKAKPRFMYTSTMHGDETTGYILSLRLIHYLLNNYGQDDRITNMLDSMEIWINPLENPDGTYTDDNSTIAGATRGNANDVDLNRNYPNPVSDPSNSLQPEAEAMINIVDSLQFVMSANMHGGIELVNFAFDSWTSNTNKHADHEWWYYVSRQYADTAQFYSPTGYMTDRDNGVTHGGDWYVIYGSRMDYMNYYAHCREVTLELSGNKLLPPEQLPEHWEYNYRSLLNHIKQARYGVRGIVNSKTAQEPLKTKIWIEGHDKDNSEVYSSTTHGDFYRPLMEGTYNITFIHDDYPDKVIQDVVVQNEEAVVLEVFMDDDILIGDVNGDGVIDVTDVIMLVDYILGLPTEGFIEQAADVNGDGKINVGDVVALVNIILEDDKIYKEFEKASIYFDDNDVYLNSMGALVAIQFQIIAEDAGTLMPDLLLDNYNLAYNVNDNILTGIVYTFDNIPFPEGYVKVMTIENYNSTMSWGEVIAADVDAEVVNVEAKDHTSVSHLEYKKLNVEIYPNPSKGRFNIEIELPVDAMIDIHIFDVMGKKVLRVPSVYYSKGVNRLEFIDNNIFKSGLYILRVNAYNANNNNFLFGNESKILIE